MIPSPQDACLYVVVGIAAVNAGLVLAVRKLRREWEHLRSHQPAPPRIE